MNEILFTKNIKTYYYIYYISSVIYIIYCMFPTQKANTIRIQGYQQVVTNTITNFSVVVRDVILNTRATLVVQCYDASGKVIEVKNLVLTGADYQNWGADDHYIVNYVARQLGFTIIAATGSTGTSA
jgi:hypothetical protein